MNLLSRIADYFSNEYKGDDETAPEFKVSVKELREIVNWHTEKCRLEANTRKTLSNLHNMKEAWEDESFKDRRLAEAHIKALTRAIEQVERIR